MRTTIAIAGLTVICGVAWVRSTSGQVQAVPGPGSGIVTVQGEVDIRRLPLVDVGQRGPWKVSLADVSDVRVVTPIVSAPLGFIKTGGRYDVIWSAGDHETIQVAQLGAGGWVRVDGQKQRWVNLSLARAVEDNR